ncbi:hypothetical protein V2J09_003702 [Rumex salicifolius]
MYRLGRTLLLSILQKDNIQRPTEFLRLHHDGWRRPIFKSRYHSGTANFRSFSCSHVTRCHKLPSSSKDVQSNSVAFRVQNLLKLMSNSSGEELYPQFDAFGLSLLNDTTVVNVLSRHSSDWKPALRFFNWVSRGSHPCGYVPGSDAYNEMLGILGKMKKFQEFNQLLNEMTRRDGILNESTYLTVVHRYAAAHNTDEAIEMFYKRKDYGMDLDLAAFEALLLSLCRYKHVEEAESLFHSKQAEFQYEIKTWNIILNGWCIRGNLREAKRFWKEIMRSKCSPDKFTYGTFINCLCKSGKISTAVKLLYGLWEKSCALDVVIVNSVIDGLCFKKRIPMAFEIVKVMRDRNCPPDVSTYNTLIKHLCNIGRMEKAYELLSEMEEKKGNCLPNATTYTHLLRSVKSKEDIPELLHKMEVNCCKMNMDIYNLLLRLYLIWGCEKSVESTWANMEKDGVGPDQRSFTIMVHGLCKQNRAEDALKCFKEMVSKGMVPEPKTKILVGSLNCKQE